MQDIQELKRWGNSQGIRIPKKMKDAAKLHLNQALELSYENETIVIRPLKQPPTLETLLLNVTPKMVGGELDWPTIGNESYD